MPTAVWVALVLAAHFALATYTDVLLTDRGGFSPAVVPGLLLVFGAAGVGGLAVSGRLSDRHPGSALPLTVAGFLVALAALALLGVAPVMYVAVLALWGFLIGLLLDPADRDAAGAAAITAVNRGIAATGALVVVVVGTQNGPARSPRRAVRGRSGGADQSR